MANVPALLTEVCIRLGYCLPPDEAQKLVSDPPTSVDAFTDAIIVAEGRDLVRMPKDERRQVRSVVAAWFDQSPAPSRRRSSWSERGHRS